MENLARSINTVSVEAGPMCQCRMARWAHDTSSSLLTLQEEVCISELLTLAQGLGDVLECVHHPAAFIFTFPTLI